MWQLLCGAHESTAKAKYSEYLKQNSACEKVIRRDITRTYPEHELFKEKNSLGQESLFNVMKVAMESLFNVMKVAMESLFNVMKVAMIRMVWGRRACSMS